MAGPTVTAESSQFSNQQTSGYGFALISLTSLFFMWGFITSLNDVLIPYLKEMFELSYTQAMLIQFCFFGAYFIVSIPAGMLVKKVGYQKGIVIGLFVASLGCLLFYPAATVKAYWIFLAALFVLASGITLLQVAANPYVSVLGKPQTASSRLTLTQAFNSLGTTIAPIWIGPIILASFAVTTHSAINSESTVQLPYLVLAASLFTLAVIFAFLKLPTIDQNSTKSDVTQQGSAWQHKHLVLGAIGIFVYVGAEVGIGSFIVSFLSLDSVASINEASASQYIGYYFGGAMVGRFIGAGVMQKISPNKVLAFNAVGASALLIVTIVSSGSLAMWSLLLIGLCNSIMFPTIFTLAIHQLKEHTSQGSGILCLAIVGGAILPLIQGALADQFGIQLAFILPLFCYAYIVYYGLSGSQPRKF
ncbi:MAG: sugar MFS transporter [Kangiellaceae bacterium]|nr:sugar MFS transporter [Kangiellaceae bacterium]